MAARICVKKTITSMSHTVSDRLCLCNLVLNGLTVQNTFLSNSKMVYFRMITLLLVSCSARVFHTWPSLRDQPIWLFSCFSILCFSCHINSCATDYLLANNAYLFSYSNSPLWNHKQVLRRNKLSKQNDCPKFLF